MQKWNIKKTAILVDFLASELSLSKKKAKSLIDSRTVYLNDKRIWMASHLLQPGDKLEAPAGLPYPPSVKKKNEYQILYEDDLLLAVNKPPYLLTDKDPLSLESLLRREKQNQSIRAVHRLDKETSGIVLFAKNDDLFESYKKMWQEKAVIKTYYAVVHNEADFKKLTVTKAIDSQPAVSHIEVAAVVKGFSIFKIEIETGRKHQIRIHTASIGHPVIGDKIYGPKVQTNRAVKSVRRQLLHAYSLKYICPLSGRPLFFAAGFAPDFVEFLKEVKLEIDLISFIDPVQ